MSRTSFRQLRKSITPRWLSEGDGGLVGYALDLMKDAFVHRAYLGLLASFPEVAPPDANAATGRDRRVVPGLFETPAQYAQRLIRWVDDRQTQGNAYSLLNRLAEYLGPGVLMRTVDNRGNWFTRNVDGTFTVLRDQGNWDWDSATAAPAYHDRDPGDTDEPVAVPRFARFWVIIYPPPSLWAITDPGWGSGSSPWGSTDRATWGSNAPADQVQTVRAIIADWKPEHTHCVNVIVAFDPASFNPASPEPDGTWEHNSKNVGGVRVRSRLSTARYWDGV